MPLFTGAQPESAIRQVISVGANDCSLDWAAIGSELDGHGCAPIKELLTPTQCQQLIDAYSHDIYRSKITMARHNFGRGEYQYYAYPLPEIVAQLRRQLYRPLAQIANHWNARLNIDTRFPARHDEYLEQCHRNGQTKPTPLILRYGENDYNCLHQDIYGDDVFPLQIACLLSQPGQDFAGGEFVLTEQRPRMQSRVEVVPLERGDAVVFAVRQRPVQGTRGTYRVNLRHGVSRLRNGQRHTLGIIFHDAA